MNVDEAIAVFDKSAERTRPNAQTEAWAVLRAHIAALTARLEDAEGSRERLNAALEIKLHELAALEVRFDRANELLASFGLDAAIGAGVKG